MRVGDILVCKKDYCPSKVKWYRFGNPVDYKKGQKYTITEIQHIDYWYNPGKYKQHIKISYNILKFENNPYSVDFIDTQIKIKSQTMNYEYIWDYFYTLKEWRKLKLQKIEREI